MSFIWRFYACAGFLKFFNVCVLQERPPCIPESVQRKRQAMETEQKKRLERDIELEEGDDYILDLRSESNA